MKPLRGLVVVGTDTGVGKTVLAAGLLRLACEQGRALLPFKPVETGCTSLSRPPDALLLRRAARRPDLPLDLVCPFRFAPPVAPAAAAALAGTPLQLPDLLRAARHLVRSGEALLIEGAGGVLSPYTPRLTILDLAARLALPVLLVARNSLGTINHTALAVQEIRRRDLPLLGYVLTDLSPPDPRQRNEELIWSLTGLAPYARLHYIRRPTLDSSARDLRSQPGVLALLRRLAPALRAANPKKAIRERPAPRASSGR